MFYVLAHQNALHTTTTGDMQPRRILFGLASCCLGDYLLTSKETFLQGVGAFALGHIFYIRYSIEYCRLTVVRHYNDIEGITSV